MSLLQHRVYSLNIGLIIAYFEILILLVAPYLVAVWCLIHVGQVCLRRRQRVKAAVGWVVKRVQVFLWLTTGFTTRTSWKQVVLVEHSMPSFFLVIIASYIYIISMGN